MVNGVDGRGHVDGLVEGPFDFRKKNTSHLKVLDEIEQIIHPAPRNPSSLFLKSHNLQSKSWKESKKSVKFQISYALK